MERRTLVSRVALLAVVACHGTGEKPVADATPSPVSSASLEASVDAGAPPRCTLAAHGAATTFGTGDELGEAVMLPDGFAIGLLGSRDGGRGGAVVRLGTGSPVTTDLGLVARDAQAPQPLVRGGEVFAVAYTVPPQGHAPAHGAGRAPRALSVFRVGATAERLVTFPAETDPSAAYDVFAAAKDAPIGALVTWDDEVGTRGVVHLASLSPDLHATHAASIVQVAPSPHGEPELVDAGDPRLALRDGGYWLTYVARRSETAKSALPLPAGEIETPSEEATYGWIEALALDADGAPKGAPHRLTSSTGHIASYAVWSHDAVLEVIAKDDGKVALGGRLERIVWKGEGEPERHVLIHGGVEEELPPVVVPDTGGRAWLSFLDVKGDTELLPLPALASAPPPLSTHEPILAGGRILGAAAGHLTLALAKGATWSLESATCTP